MSRLSIILTLTSAALCASCGPGSTGTACAKDVLLPKAQLCFDREGLGFGQEFGSATLIGTKPIETLALRNGGIEDLVITSADISGDSAFKLIRAWDNHSNIVPPPKVRGNYLVQADGGLFNTGYVPPAREGATLSVEFAPTAAKQYLAQVTVNTNSQNRPTFVFQISGCGLPADGGTSPCYRVRDCTMTNDAGVSICADGGR